MCVRFNGTEEEVAAFGKRFESAVDFLQNAVKRQNSVCSACGKGNLATKLQACSVCKLALYCSKECQKRDWKQHKPHCVKAKKV